jgi:hypothetical protein
MGGEGCVFFIFFFYNELTNRSYATLETEIKNADRLFPLHNELTSHDTNTYSDKPSQRTYGDPEGAVRPGDGARAG